MERIKNERIPWIAVDLDGSLATYDHWRGETHIGEPIQPMLDRVKRWIDRGYTVKIFTARVAGLTPMDDVVVAIDQWCMTHIGGILEVTNVKDFDMIVLFDDRAIGLVGNTGEIVGGDEIEAQVEMRIEAHY